MILPIRAQGDPYQQHQGQEFAGPKVCFSSGTGNRRCWDSLDFDTGPPPASCSSHVYIPPSRILPLRPCRHGLELGNYRFLSLWSRPFKIQDLWVCVCWCRESLGVRPVSYERPRGPSLEQLISRGFRSHLARSFSHSRRDLALTTCSGTHDVLD